MTKKQVKRYGATLKAKIVLEALKNEKTLAELGSEHKIHPKNIQLWKRQFLANVEVVFDKEVILKEYKEALKQEAEKTDELHRQIGELTAQLNWAKKKSKEVGLEY